MPHRFRAARSLLVAAILAAFPAAAQSGGSIEGQVELSPRAARRVASSYPGAAGGTHVVGSVPPVAFLVGRIAGAPPAAGTYAAKTRYRQSDAPCTLAPAPDGFRLDFDAPQWAVTPGQSAVLYDGEVCLGGGVIAAALEAMPA